MKIAFLPRLLCLFALALASTAALATAYDFSGGVGGATYPPCDGWGGVKGWTVSGTTTFTCSKSITLAVGDSIANSKSITVVGDQGITLAGGNTVGSASKTVDLKITSGVLSASNSAGSSSTIYGNLTSESGSISLSSVTLNGNIVSSTGNVTLSGASTVMGSITTGGWLSVAGGSVGGNISASNGVTMTGGTHFKGSISSSNSSITLAGGSVLGDVSGHGGVTTTSGTVISGDVKASNGPVNLSGGSVGSVFSTCCSLTTNGTDIKGDVNATIGSSRDTVSITGGTISGAISTSGGNGISITNATVTSGSITTTSVSIVISNSNIGTPSSPVNVTNNGKQSIAIKGNSVVYGNVTTGGTLTIDPSATVYGDCSFQSITGKCSPFVPGPDHIRVFFNNATALTCAPRTLDAIACKNSTCSARYASPVSVTLSPGGTTATIPVGGTGTPSVARTSEGVATIALAASNPAVTALRCYEGAVASPGNLVSPCNLTFSKSGFFVSVPDHRSCTTQTLTVTAAKADDKTKTCVPAFNGVSRDIKLRFAYASPESGATSPVFPTVGSASPPATALATATDVSLAMTFSNGAATTNLRYNDAGSLSVTASYTGSAATGDAGLSMGTVAGSAFVVAPAKFEISGIPAVPLTAGKEFNVTVTAKNSCGATTANFGNEKTPATALLTLSNPSPGWGNVDQTDISQTSKTLSGFKEGEASTKLIWNEVGTVDVTATTSKYLASSFDVVGTQAAVGRFQPAYFDAFVSHGCSGVFTYAGLAPAIAGQPFTVEVKAKRFGGSLNDDTSNTANYEKNAVDPAVIWSKEVTLSDANGGTGTLANNTFSAASFSAGKAKRSDVRYALATKLTAPYKLVIRATDADTPAVSSSGHSEGSTLMRSGRLRLSNAYGSEKATLSLLVQAQYWSGYSWVQNSDDACSSLPKDTFALFDPSGAASTCSSVSGAVSWSGGQGNLVLNKPSGVCSIDVAANLGASGNDQSCLASHGGVAANLAWLRSRNGSCASTYDRDPSARASFGVYSPELKRTVHVRELY